MVLCFVLTIAPSRSGGSFIIYLPAPLSSSLYLSIGLIDSGSRKKDKVPPTWVGAHGGLSGSCWSLEVLFIKCEPQGKSRLGEGKDSFKLPAGDETSSAHLSLDGIFLLGEDLKCV